MHTRAGLVLQPSGADRHRVPHDVNFFPQGYSLLHQVCILIGQSLPLVGEDDLETGSVVS
jgi:hypothetical protein